MKQPGDHIATTEVLPREQAARVDLINSFHRRFVTDSKRAHVYRFLAGVELNRQKAALPHGEFGKWCKAYLPDISNGSVHNYMNYAERGLAKFPSLEKLTERLQITNGELPEADQIKPLEKAIFEITDGKDVTEAFRYADIIRPPKDPNAAEKKRTKLSPEEEVAAERETAIGIAHQVIQAMRAARGLGEDEGATLTLLPKSEQDALKAEYALFGKALKKYCKRGKGKGAKK